MLDEGEDVLLDMPSLEADVNELLEKRDETPFFGKIDSDLTEANAPARRRARPTLEIERHPVAFGGGSEDEIAARGR